MDESKIRSQDFFTTINYIASNHVANDFLWDWVQLNYDALVARYKVRVCAIRKCLLYRVLVSMLDFR